ncbi:MAG: bifunctional phosphoribosyl-AMP cyclohydrolase/phosphoribosyl-ATP diphosphatase HisIE [Peptococcaceae bacterium]|jgi:phosphoribosyl-ATP pyrophosphohydrolase/phosphoribosyl-AMP cyclohydrolase|nr:bifunctional phosphoribosyl-AMP cyclohydrolase/phosphoribosyl-ATP diphosphatase HisIE [Peptococcaceae bacterium]
MKVEIEGIRWNSDGLIPVVVQDELSREVLMLAYMNEEALRRTLAEGRAWYWSRSRQEFWRKGDTSGHIQIVREVYFDCDRDAILLLVEQTGMACHEDYFTCFHYQAGEREWKTTGAPRQRPSSDLGGILTGLAEVIHSRRSERPDGSYTVYLFDKGLDKILKKVGEETAEVIIAAKNPDRSELCYEASDLLYHLLVLLEEQGVSLREIAAELAKRSK